MLDLDGHYGLHPQVALRPEEFGALAYHYGNRRLTFLKSPLLVELVQRLDTYDTVRAAVSDLVPDGERQSYERALEGLVGSEVIGVC
jgi:putative mycofactocin binding protein MftB